MTENIPLVLSRRILEWRLSSSFPSPWNIRINDPLPHKILEPSEAYLSTFSAARWKVSRRASRKPSLVSRARKQLDLWRPEECSAQVYDVARHDANLLAVWEIERAANGQREMRGRMFWARGTR